MTKRVHRSADGMYHIGSKAFPHLLGSRRQVCSGTAYKTAGGLTETDLMRNKNGRYVSRKKHASSKREMRLVKHGYTARKGKFGAVKMSAVNRKRTASRRRTRGGSDAAVADSSNATAAAASSAPDAAPTITNVTDNAAPK